VAKVALTPVSALGGMRHEHDGVTLTEVAEFGLLSVATPSGGESALNKTLIEKYQVGLPAAGESVISAVNGVRLLGLQPDQCMALWFDKVDSLTGKELVQELADVAYLTDQSDSWVALRIEGPQVRTVLERICPIDLHPDSFPQGRVVRTIMEHLATLVLCDAVDSFVLLSPRSSAQSFLHAIETSVRNVV